MSIHKLFDPWLEQDERWAPHQLLPDDNLAQPDLTNSAIKNFLRSPDGRRELITLLPPQPPTNPVDDDGPRLDHIHGY
jgi:hypothetical protein